MTENNNEIKWVEVEQVKAPGEAPAQPAPEAAPAAFGAVEPEAPAPDPFNVEPKLEEVEAKAAAAEANPVDNDPFGFDGSVHQASSNPNFNPGSEWGDAGNNYQTYTAPEMQPEHGKAVASLVLGILGLCCCGICSIIAFLFAGQAQNAGNTEGICKAGRILGIVGMAIWALGIVLNFVTGVFSAMM